MDSRIYSTVGSIYAITSGMWARLRNSPRLTNFRKMVHISKYALGVICIMGCATKGMGPRTHLVPDNIRAWEAHKCEEHTVRRVHKALLRGRGSPGSAMYYYRCKGPNDYQMYLKTIKNRWKPIKGRRR